MFLPFALFRSRFFLYKKFPGSACLRIPLVALSLSVIACLYTCNSDPRAFPTGKSWTSFRKSGEFKWSLCHTNGSFISHAVNQQCIRQNRKNSSEEVVSIKCCIISVVRPLNNLIYSLDFAVARFLMKLFKISDNNIISECRCDYSSFEFALPSKLLKMF